MNYILIFLITLSIGTISAQSFTEVNQHGWGCNELIYGGSIVDLDNDGLFEIMNRTSSLSLSIWEQTSQNSFQLQLIDRGFNNNMESMLTPLVSDLDNDGLREIIYKVGGNYGTWILKEEDSANSLNFVTVTQNFNTINWWGISNFVDLDNDQLLDCVILTHENGVGYHYHLYEQESLNSFNLILKSSDIFPNIKNYFIPRVIDIDQNGLMDLIVQDNEGDQRYLCRYEQESQYSSSFQLLDNNFLELDQYFTSGSDIHYYTDILVVGDFNQNGRVDIIVTDSVDERKVFVVEQMENNPNEFTLVEENIVNFYDLAGENHQILDLDGDGLNELFTIIDGKISLYKQLESDIYKFELLESNFCGLEGVSNVNFYDIDGDGKMEMVAGEALYKQSEADPFKFEYITTFPSYYVGFDFCDLDSDGLLEMIAGDEKGVLYLLQQDQNYPYQFEDSNISLGGEIDLQWQAAPTIVDIDDDGKLDLFIGGWHGNIRHLVQSEIGSFNFDTIDNFFLDLNCGYNSSIDFSDINGDGLLDFVGEGNAGFYLFTQNSSSTITNTPETTDLKFKNYPNPFNPDTNFQFELQTRGLITIDIFNSKGEKVRSLGNSLISSGLHSISWDGKDLNNRSVSSGIYYALLSKDGNFVSRTKSILIK